MGERIKVTYHELSGYFVCPNIKFRFNRIQFAPLEEGKRLTTIKKMNLVNLSTCDPLRESAMPFMSKVQVYLIQRVNWLILILFEEKIPLTVAL